MFSTERFIAFDVETPNRFNNSICSIGISVIENLKTVESRHYLVNPYADFDWQNVMIHGITPEDVSSSPDFEELWRFIGPVMGSGILCAHNAAFDLRVLRSLFTRYGIHMPVTPYVCTYQMTRKLFKNLPNHKLNTVSDYFGIDLTHHNAGSDSYACGEILCRTAKMGFPIQPHIRYYDFSPNGGTLRCKCR